MGVFPSTIVKDTTQTGSTSKTVILMAAWRYNVDTQPQSPGVHQDLGKVYLATRPGMEHCRAGRLRCSHRLIPWRVLMAGNGFAMFTHFSGIVLAVAPR